MVLQLSEPHSAGEETAPRQSPHRPGAWQAALDRLRTMLTQSHFLGGSQAHSSCS